MENISNNLRGMYRDTLFNSENRLVFDSGWTSNTIVFNCRVLLASLFASFMKGEPVLGEGYMKVGWGSEDWRSGDLVQPAASQDVLVNEYRNKIVKIDSIRYLYEDNSPYLDENNEPYNRLEIKVTLGKNFPNESGHSDLREFGLFGKQKDKKERMINCVNHPLIQKAETDTLIRVVRLVF